MLCKFVLAYIGKCGEKTLNNQDFCKEHLNLKCVECDSQSVTQCSATFASGICGYPICEKHGHCNDCDCDFTFINGIRIHDDHDIIVTKEFYKEVPDKLKDEVTTY